MVDPATRKQFATLVAAALVDGDLAESERQVLRRKASEMDVPLGMMSDMIQEARQGKLSITIPATTEEKQALLDDLIDVACADGRVEAGEHHLLAKFASHLGLTLPDIRARVKQRMEKNAPRQTRVQSRPEPPRPEPPRPRAEFTPPTTSLGQSPSLPRRGPAPSSPDLTADVGAPLPAGPMQMGTVSPSSASTPMLPPGPMQLDPPKPPVAGISDIPPITLQLLKQAILFETEQDSVRYIERTLNITSDEARKIRDRLINAFPELKSNQHQMKSAPRWTDR